MRFSPKLMTAAAALVLLVPLAACPKRPAVETETPATETETVEAPAAETPPDPEAIDILPDPGGDLDLEIDDVGAHGGAAHVHGLASLAAILEGNELIVALESPLDNFGLGEATEASALNAKKLFDSAIQIDGGTSCTRAGIDAEVQRSGDHGSVVLTGTYTCTAPDQVSGVTFKGFAAFPGFEQISANYIAPDSSNAADLTPDDATLIFD